MFDSHLVLPEYLIDIKYVTDSGISTTEQATDDDDDIISSSPQPENRPKLVVCNINY